MITGQGDIQNAIEAVRGGAFDFFEKPVRPKLLKATVQRALQFKKLQDDAKRNAEILSRSEEQLRALSSKLLKVQEQERARVSKEIHDELGQLLTVLKMDLFWLR